MPQLLLRLRASQLSSLLLLVLLLLAACAPTVAPGAAPAAPADAAPEAGATQADQVRIAILEDEGTLTPHTYVSGYPGYNLLSLQYDSLYQLDLAGIPQPWLATGSESSEDGLTVTLTLREDVLWHDGEALTAEDVAFTFDYFRQYEQSRFTRAFSPVASVTAEGDYTVVITLATPAPSLEIGLLAEVPILPQHVWSEITTPDELTFDPANNIGSGPYKLVEYTPDQFYRLEANNDYFAGSPNVAEIVLIKFADDAGALAALRSGEVDMLTRPVAPEQIDLLAAEERLAVLQGPLYTTQMINYDMQRAPFDRLEVRQAMALAINYQDLVDTVYLGAATVGNPGWIHPESPVYNSAIQAVYDPAQAQQILDDAGLVDSDGDGVREADGEALSFEFLVNGGDSLRLRLAELVSEMLSEVGIEANVTAVEQTTVQEAVWPSFDVAQGRNYAMAIWGWSAPVQADPVRFGNLVHSDPAIGVTNVTGYMSAEADALAEAIATEPDDATRAELIGELQALVAQDLPFILLLYPDGAYAYNRQVYDGWAFMTGQGVLHKLSFLPEEAQLQ